MLLYCQALTSLILGCVLIVVLFSLSKMGTSMFSKTIPFECGFIPAGDARVPFSIQFFLISLVFLIFDVELILLFPMMVEHLNILTMSVMGYIIFVLLMASGLIWEWSQGSLEWLK